MQILIGVICVTVSVIQKHGLCVINYADLISCYMLSHRTREALACASEMCKKIHTCRSLTVSSIHLFSA